LIRWRRFGSDINASAEGVDVAQLFKLRSVQVENLHQCR
jgi:hypothetical protein